MATQETRQLLRFLQHLPLSFRMFSGRVSPKVRDKEVIFFEDLTSGTGKIFIRFGDTTYEVGAPSKTPNTSSKQLLTVGQAAAPLTVPVYINAHAVETGATFGFNMPQSGSITKISGTFWNMTLNAGGGADRNILPEVRINGSTKLQASLLAQTTVGATEFSAEAAPGTHTYSAGDQLTVYIDRSNVAIDQDFDRIIAVIEVLPD